MTYVSDTGTAIRSDITSFVVAEDQSLEARLKRSYQRARQKAQDTTGQTLDTVARLGSHRAWLAGVVGAHWQGITAVAAGLAGRFRPMRAEASPMLEEVLDTRWKARMRDVASLGAMACRATGRVFWRQSTAFKLTTSSITLAVAAIALWPVSDEVPAAEPLIVAPIAAVALPQRLDIDQWKPVAAPIAAFHLEAPELDRSGMRYRARMQADGARQELMIWGAGAADPARKKLPLFGAVSIEHYPQSQPERDTPYIDLVRRAALAGAGVERVGSPIGLNTKFGIFETADATLVTEGTRRTCLVYRHAAEAVPLQIHGWFCGTAERPIDRSSLGCMLDRIDLLSAGNDKALRAYFASVERARQPCGTARLVTAKSSWLDPNGPMPVLKASFSAQ